MEIKNTRMLELGANAISYYLSLNYGDISTEDYFLLDSFKKQIIEYRNKLKQETPT